MNLLITGGNGYIAKSLNNALNERYTVTSISRNDFDLTDNHQTYEWFKGKTFDVVIHTAISGGSRLQMDQYSVFTQNMAMFDNLVENKDCFSKLITFGSGAEFFHGNIPYANSKRQISKEIIKYPNFYNLRIFGVFDHNELDTRFIKSNIIRYLKKEPMVIHANKIMDFFYMKDLISLVEYYMINDGLEQDINCSYEHKYTLQNIANFINTLGSHKVPVVIQDKKKFDFYCGGSDLPIPIIGASNGIRETFNKLSETIL
jgi:nucleoside-diphosphate-sugar epimerase